jgi:hypothetical protein
MNGMTMNKRGLHSARAVVGIVALGIVLLVSLVMFGREVSPESQGL